MNSTRNRAMVHAEFLRSAVVKLGALAIFCPSCVQKRDDAVLTIEQVAAELEAQAAAPDPAETADATGHSIEART